MRNRQNIRRIAAAVAALAVAGGAPAIANASTMTGDVTGGTLDWGVKESFRSYVVSPVADGEIETSGGAEQNSDGSFRFAGGTGSVGDGSAELAFTGTVRFTGHAGELELIISDPSVQIDGSTGTLTADVSSLSPEGELAEFPGAVLGDLDISGVTLEPDADGMVAVSGVPAVLSDAGAPAFGGFYDAGEALDPVSFTVQASAGDQDTDDTADNTSDQNNTDNDGQGSGGADDASDQADDPAAAAQDEDALPKTGAPWQLVGIGGLVLVAAGAAFVLLGRRRVTSGAGQ